MKTKNAIAVAIALALAMAASLAISFHFIAEGFAPNKPELILGTYSPKGMATVGKLTLSPNGHYECSVLSTNQTAISGIWEFGNDDFGPHVFLNDFPWDWKTCSVSQPQRIRCDLRRSHGDHRIQIIISDKGPDCFFEKDP